MRHVYRGLVLAILLAAGPALAAPAFVTAGACAKGIPSGSVFLSYPASTTAGHLAIAQVATHKGSARVYATDVNGFSLDYQTFDSGDTGTITQTIFHRVLTGAEGGTTAQITFDGAFSNRYVARMWIFSGASATFEGASVNTLAASATVADAGVTTTDVDRLALNFTTLRDDQSSSSFTVETGGDWTLVSECLDGASSPDSAIALQSAVMATAGTVDGGSYTVAGTPSTLTHGFALIPSASSPGAIVVN